MMIKFSWNLINNKFDWNANSVLEYFYLKRKIKLPHFLSRKIPEKVKKAVKEPFSPGSCYLLNIDAALENAKNPFDLYVYLELASKRSLFDYKLRKVKHLPIAFVPEYLKPWVSNNPMLKIENDNIYFKYEQE